ncbi:MAG: hypothetical protein B7Z82_02245 [Halothiobacillus sp. 20-54-6]|nr:MAG: hypothetical protein B7Z82_02245 [Halothiobacillus sp. 20-54-6]
MIDGFANVFAGLCTNSTASDCAENSSSHSTDRTAAIAARLASAPRLHIVAGQPLLPGWTGKLWAIQQGLALPLAQDADYILLIDADIEHAPGHISALVAKAERSARMEAASGQAPNKTSGTPAAKAVKPGTKTPARPVAKTGTKTTSKPGGRKSALTARPAAKPATRASAKPTAGRKPTGGQSGRKTDR